MGELAIGDTVSFMWGGIPRTGKVIGESSTKVLIQFNYKPDQVKEQWIGREVLSLSIPNTTQEDHNSV